MENIYIYCFIYKYSPKADTAAIKLLLKDIDVKHTELIKNINTKEGRGTDGRSKTFYKKLIDDFTQSINKFNKEIEALP